MMIRFAPACVIITLAAAAAAQPACDILVIEGRGYDARYGTPRWSQMTTLINSSFASVTVAPDMTNLASMLTYDCIWVDQRLDETLPAAEAANLQAYLATGRRVAMIGENGNWPKWNASILSITGGSVANAFFSGVIPPVAAHPLTAGVAGVNVVVGSTISGGGTQLFADNFAPLDGPSQNFLTIFDSNLFDTAVIGGSSNQRFAENIMGWLCIPAPSSVSLALAGLIAVGRRRR